MTTAVTQGPPAPNQPPHVHDQLALCTCRIVTISADGRSGSGTGFFVSGDNWAAVFTNKHVIENAVSLSMVIDTELKGGGDRRQDTLHFTNFEQMQIAHPAAEVDLVALPLSKFLDDVARIGRRPLYRNFRRTDLPSPELLASMTAVENVLMIGYPIGLWDSHNNRPIIRRGITATAYNLNYNKTPQFVIDAACFPGSSGSPIVLYESNNFGGIAQMGEPRFALLGALWGGPRFDLEGELVTLPIPTAAAAVPLSRIPTNLGFCVNATAISQLMDLIDARIGSEAAVTELLKSKPKFA